MGMNENSKKSGFKDIDIIVSIISLWFSKIFVIGVYGSILFLRSYSFELQEFSVWEYVFTKHPVMLLIFVVSNIISITLSALGLFMIISRNDKAGVYMSGAGLMSFIGVNFMSAFFHANTSRRIFRNKEKKDLSTRETSINWRPLNLLIIWISAAIMASTYFVLSTLSTMFEGFLG